MSDLFDIRIEFTYAHDPLGATCREIRRLRARPEELKAENERLKAFISDRIHDATREEMLMAIDHRGSHE